MASSSPTASTVQHVTKASSDRLLRKFAELDDPAPPPAPPLLLRAPIRRKRSRRAPPSLSAREVTITGTDSPAAAVRRRNGSLAEWKALLPPTSSRRSTALARRTGIGRSELGSGLLLAALEKTWRKTVEGASNLFVKKHCTRHVRLISDVI